MQKKIPKNEAKDGQIQKLKKRIAKLEKENNKLKSELRTLETYLDKTREFMKDSTKEVALEDLIEKVNTGANFKEIENDSCPNCGDDISKLPTGHGILHLCKSCGYRKVIT